MDEGLNVDLVNKSMDSAYDIGFNDGYRAALVELSVTKIMYCPECGSSHISLMCYDCNYTINKPGSYVQL